MKENWTSIHIFYHDINKFDEIILRISEKMEELENNNFIKKWFFIRYWEGGPHIRIRYLSDNDEYLKKMLIKYFQQVVNSIKTSVELFKDEYYLKYNFDGKNIDINQLPWFQHGQIVEIEYVPEIERYGGDGAIEISESIFKYSTNLVCLLIEEIGNNFGKKIIISVALFNIFLKEYLKFDKEKEEQMYLNFYKTYWEGFKNESIGYTLKKILDVNDENIEKVIKNIKSKLIIKKEIDNIKILIDKVRDSINDEIYFHNIIASHLHMTNNRLGIPPVYEYYISEYLSEKLN